VAERLVCCHGEAAARALVALLEDEWRQLKALRRRFAGDTPGSILKRRSPGSPRACAPGLLRLGRSCQPGSGSSAASLAGVHVTVLLH